MRRIDLTGQRFGRLTVQNYSHSIRGLAIWNCECDCGSSTTTRGSELRKGTTLSCGCLRKEITSERFTRHGRCQTRMYSIWSDMKKRCDNPNHKHYDKYGGRGIAYCERWKDFTNFYEDMHATYQDHLTIDRIDFNGNYEKGNCRWTTMDVQWNNTRKCVFIEIDGIRDTVKNMCRKYNSKYDRVVRCIKQGKDPWEMIQKYKLASV